MSGRETGERMKRTQKELVLCRQEDWASGLRSGLELRGDRIELDVGSRRAGFLCFPAVDSGQPGFGWQRVRLGAHLPEGSALRVYAYASDSRSWEDWPDLDRGLAALSPDGPETGRVLERLFGPPAAHSGDFLAGRSGRYLWLMAELVSSGVENPFLHSLTLWLDGDHMADYLPALYQGDDFTRRFLSVFNSMVLDLEARIDALPGLLDWAQAEGALLRGLAAWVCLDGERVDEERLRAWIPTALDDFEQMYTVEGVRRTVERLTGRRPILIEHHRMDPNDPSCINPAVHRRLYGDDPFRFFVLLDEDSFPSRDRMEEFLVQMEGRIPAGLSLELVLLKRCVQLDWHTYLGINSVVGSYTPAALDETMTIHFDTMIGGHDIERL